MDPSHVPRPSSSWPAGGFRPHTLVLSFGKMAEELMRLCHRDEKFLAKVRGAADTKAGKMLLSTGLADGSVYVLCHEKMDQYYVLLQHGDASVLAPVAFDRTHSRLSAIWLAEVKGDQERVVDFCGRMTSSIAQLNLRGSTKRASFAARSPGAQIHQLN